jgi:D-aspartate ligase
LRPIGFNGLVEIEYKVDHRDGQNKSPDADARVWGFYTLGFAAGADLPYLQCTDQLGIAVNPCHGRPEGGWLRFVAGPANSRIRDPERPIECSFLLSLARMTHIESVFSPHSWQN